MSTTGDAGSESAVRYWINTVCREHVLIGREGRFTQADHGSAVRLRRLDRGDWIAFYSPRTRMRGGEMLQHFTALGRIADDTPYRVEVAPDVRPWRREVDFAAVREAPVRPLLAQLEFVRDKRRWGLPFRRGLFSVSEGDFRRIAAAMGVSGDRFSTG